MDDEPSATTRTERLRAEDTVRLEALLRGAGPHVEALVDVGTTASGDLLLVLERPAARLVDLLAVPGFPTPGEAVTITVPLAQALDRLHAAGVALGGAAVEQVHVDDRGAPSWSPPSSAVLARRAGRAAFERAVARDLASFTTLAEGLLDRAGRPSALPEDVDDLVDVLFALADPEPVRLAPVPHPAAADALPAGPFRRDAEHRPTAEAPEAAVASPPLAVAERARVALRSVRPRVWALAATAVGGLVAALVLLPSGPSEAEHAAPAPTVSARAGATGPASGGTPGSRTEAPRGAHAAAAATVAPPGITGRAALPRLLAGRAACLAGSDTACLDRVDAAGSPALSADRAAAAGGAGAPQPDPRRIRVLSEGGGTVVADVDGATVVAVRQRDGWRLRDVVAEPPR